MSEGSLMPHFNGKEHSFTLDFNFFQNPRGCKYIHTLQLMWISGKQANSSLKVIYLLKNIFSKNNIFYNFPLCILYSWGNRELNLLQEIDFDSYKFVYNHGFRVYSLRLLLVYRNLPFSRTGRPDWPFCKWSILQSWEMHMVKTTPAVEAAPSLQHNWCVGYLLTGQSSKPVMINGKHSISIILK